MGIIGIAEVHWRNNEREIRKGKFCQNAIQHAFNPARDLKVPGTELSYPRFCQELHPDTGDIPYLLASGEPSLADF